MLYPLSYGGSATGRGYQLPVGWPGYAARVIPGRVLVVDDDDVIRQLISVNLELEGFEVFTATDGVDALARVRDINPSVVTLDVMMPRLDGWEAATRLRADPATAHVKVVLLSARAQDTDLRRGDRIGVDAYLTKPFDPDELIAIVRRLSDAARAEFP